MKNFVRRGLLAGVVCLAPTLAQPADLWTGFKNISSLQVVETGGFLISFSTPLATPCASSGPSTLYVYPGQNAMTADGVKAHYATALAAFLSGKQISVMYESASAYCWGRYLAVQ